MKAIKNTKIIPTPWEISYHKWSAAKHYRNDNFYAEILNSSLIQSSSKLGL